MGHNIVDFDCLHQKHDKFNEKIIQMPVRSSYDIRKQVSEVKVDLGNEVEDEIDALNMSEIKCCNCEEVGRKCQRTKDWVGHL